MKLNTLGTGIESSAYIIDHYKVLLPALNYINSICNDESSDNRTFVCHVIVCQLIDPWQEYVPVSYRLIKKTLPKARVQDLVEKGIIEERIFEVQPDGTEYKYLVKEGFCKEYKVKDEILDEFLRLNTVEFEQRVKMDKFNLFTQKKSKSLLKNQKYDDNRNQEPKLIVSAMDIIKQNFFNKSEIEKHVNNLKEKMEATLLLYGKTSKEYKEIKGQYIHDNHCFNVIADQGSVHISGDIWAYTPAWKVQMSGRISHIQCGLQSASRKMKAAAYTGLERVKNYDLKSSQICMLIQLFEEANQYGCEFDTSWFVSYKNNPNAKSDYAERVGISEDAWKDCLCALLFQAWLSPASKRTKNKLQQLDPSSDTKPQLNSILEILYKEANGDVDLTMNYLSKLTEAFGEAKGELNRWGDWLYDEFSVKTALVDSKGGRYIKNRTGKSLHVSSLKEQLSRFEVISKISAFLLQGLEASFIHHLTLLSLKYNYQVLCNEHDGVVSIGEIPYEAIQEATKISGAYMALLVEKPLG
jgi:hypothetical protein